MDIPSVAATDQDRDDRQVPSPHRHTSARLCRARVLLLLKTGCGRSEISIWKSLIALGLVSPIHEIPWPHTAGRNSDKQQMAVNPDGSVDVFVGPTAPDGLANN